MSSPAHSSMQQHKQVRQAQSGPRELETRKALKNNTVDECVCVYTCMQMPATVHVWRSEGKLWESGLPSRGMGEGLNLGLAAGTVIC